MRSMIARYQKAVGVVLKGRVQVLEVDQAPHVILWLLMRESKVKMQER